MMRTVHLHGRLKKQFGAKHTFDIDTAIEAIRALNCAFPGDFFAELEKGAYRIVRGAMRTGMALDIELASNLRLGHADLHIIPVATGASNGKAVGKTILGAVLIGAAVFMSGGLAGGGLLAGMGTAVPFAEGVGLTWGNIALIGLGLALSGASTLLANATSTADENKKDDSFSINGPSNLAQQGSAVPLIYGETMVGSTVVSFDADIEDIGAYQGGQGSITYLGGKIGGGM